MFSQGWPLLFLVLLRRCHAHEICDISIQKVSNGPLAFCTDFAERKSCCDQERDQGLSSDFQEVVQLVQSTECLEALKPVYCAHCDSWEEHLFELGLPGGAPILCQEFCKQIYSACENEILVGSLFNSKLNGTLKQVYDSESGFCSVFAPQEKTLTIASMEGRTSLLIPKLLAIPLFVLNICKLRHEIFPTSEYFPYRILIRLCSLSR